MGQIGTIMQAGGGLFSAYGTLKKGQMDKELADKEAANLELQAQFAVERGEQEAALVRRKGQEIQGAQKSSYAAQGVDVTSGSAAQMQEATGVESEADVVQIKLNAAREAWGLKEQAKIERWQGETAKYQSRLDAQGQMFGTGAQAASSYNSNKSSSKPSSKPRSKPAPQPIIKDLSKGSNKDSNKM